MLAKLLLDLIAFILLSISCFLLPGLQLLTWMKIKLGPFDRIIFSSITGYVLFSLTGYLLLLINFSIINIPLFILLSLYYLYQHKNHFKSRPSLNFKKVNLIFILVITVGIIGQLAIIAPSGRILGQSLVFWSALGHDGLWHIALIEELKKGFPLQNPVFANSRLVNYHYFSDIAPAIFSQFANISSLDLFFRFFPLLFSLWLGSSTYFVVKKLSNNISVGIWSMFFVLFSGSFGYFISLVKDKSLNGETKFWSTQLQSSSGNPPQLISLVLVLAFLYFFQLFSKDRNWRLALICIILASPLAVFKIYAAIVVILTLVIIFLIDLIKNHSLAYFFLILPIAIISAVLFLPNSSSSSEFLIFQPWWFIRTMIVAPDKLDWLDLELKRQTYLYHHSYLRVLQIELTGFVLFVFGNLGTKFIGLWQFKNIIRNLADKSNQFILLISLISLIFPLLFLQKGVAGNTIQFLQYFLLFFAILAGITTAQVLARLRNNYLKSIFVILIVIFSVPTQVGLIYDFYKRPPFAQIQKEELDALDFLHRNTSKDIVVLSPAFDRNLKVSDSTPPIWAWSDTAYIGAISSRRVFVADTEQLDIMGYNYKQRQDISLDIFNETNSSNFKTLLSQNNINYIYLTNTQVKPKVDLPSAGLKLFYKNKIAEIWKVI